MNNRFADSRIGKRETLGSKLASRDGWDVVAVEVFAAFFGGEVIIHRMKQLSLPIVIEADADGYFMSCPALQGCYSQGNSYEEAVENIKDAIRLHVEDRYQEGKR